MAGLNLGLFFFEEEGKFGVVFLRGRVNLGLIFEGAVNLMHARQRVAGPCGRWASRGLRLLAKGYFLVLGHVVFPLVGLISLDGVRLFYHVVSVLVSSSVIWPWMCASCM